MSRRYLIFTGHPGVGSGSVAAHLAAAYAEAGRRTVLVGAVNSPARALVLGRSPRNEGAWSNGYKGVACRVEEFAGRNWADGLKDDILRRTPDAELVLIEIGDNLPALAGLLNAGLAHQVLAVTDAEPESLETVNRLWRALADQPVEAGLIGNSLTEPYAGPIVQDFARKTGTGLQGYLPRALAVFRSAFFGETVIEAAPLAHVAYLYRDLAKLVLNPGASAMPEPLDDEEFRDWAESWGDRLFDLGEEYVGFGSGI